MMRRMRNCGGDVEEEGWCFGVESFPLNNPRMTVSVNESEAVNFCQHYESL